MVKLTIEQKARLLSGDGWWHTYEIEGLLPAIFMCDGPHGLRIQRKTGDHLGINESDVSVCYPTESTIACSFDKKLLFQLGKTLGKEARANSSDMVLGPGVNIKRTPLCGRNFEYYSEDPVVSGELGAAFVNGLQSVGVSCCVKHFACNNIEYRRNFSDSRMTERTLREIYLKAFEIIVKKASPRAIMCAYNLVNGVFCSENKKLLTDVLRDEWGFDGIVVSDWGAVVNEASAVKAGLDLAMPEGEIYKRLKLSYDKGEITETEISAAAERVAKFVLDCVDNRKKYAEPFSRDSALALVKTAAEESAVLLKNENNFFPLKSGEKILFTGDATEDTPYQGGGSSHVNNANAISLLNALKETKLDYEYVRGCDTERGTTCDIDFSPYDKIIVSCKLREADESEGYDRKNLKLSPAINKLVLSAVKSGKRVGVLLFVGGVVELPWAGKTDGIMLCGLPGENGCFGIADLLAGKCSPCGKLAETWVKTEKQLSTYSLAVGNGKAVDYNEGVFVGYRYYENKGIKPLFPFGYGLSYTKFAYSEFAVRQSESDFTITFSVKNVGEVDGKETAFVFARHPVTNEPRPIKTLIDFEKKLIKKGQTETFSVTVPKNSLCVYDENGRKYLPSGNYGFLICSTSAKIEGKLTVSVIGEKSVVTAYTLMSEIWQNKKQKAIFQKNIIDRLLPLFGLDKLPENTERILLESPLRNFKGLAPSVITEEILEKTIKELNEV